KKVDKDALIFHVPDRKKGVGDSGYPTTAFGRVKSRQETYFSRIKGFSKLKNRFRRGKRGTNDEMLRHKYCFESIALIILYDLEDHPLFEV
ncbi:hypothetical protein ACHAXM_000024, partial [Skeletonema potamos]